MSREWMSYKLTFGKYKGHTMYMVYTNDFGYIADYLDNEILDAELRIAVDAAIEHNNIVGPFSRSTTKSDWEERNGF